MSIPFHLVYEDPATGKILDTRTYLKDRNQPRPCIDCKEALAELPDPLITCRRPGWHKQVLCLICCAARKARKA